MLPDRIQKNAEGGIQITQKIIYDYDETCNDISMEEVIIDKRIDRNASSSERDADNGASPTPQERKNEQQLAQILKGIISQNKGGYQCWQQ